MTPEERASPIYDKARLEEVFEALKQKGVMVYDIKPGEVPHGTWNDKATVGAMSVFMRKSMLADIVPTPFVSFSETGFLRFASLEDAKQHMRNLYEQLPKRGAYTKL